MTIEHVIESLRPAIDAALKDVAAAHGVAELRTGTAKFSRADGYFEITLQGHLETGKSKGEVEYERLRALMPSLPPHGTEFSIPEKPGVTYKIIGATSRKRVIASQSGADCEASFAPEHILHLTGKPVPQPVSAMTGADVLKLLKRAT